jgi:hypothetical protein
MNMSKSQAPRANAGGRVNFKVEQHQHRPSKADPASIWFARRFPMSTMLARVLAALASLGRALQ